MKKSKRLLGLLLSVVMLVGVVFSVNISAFANPAVEDQTQAANKLGDSITYSFDEATGVVTLTGTGATYNFDYSNESPFQYNKKVKKVVVGDGITKIGDNIFRECYNLKNIVLPEGLEEIGEYAFSMEYSGQRDVIESLNMPTSVKLIKMGAFAESQIIRLYTDIDFSNTTTTEIHSYNDALKNATMTISSTQPAGDWIDNKDGTWGYKYVDSADIVKDSIELINANWYYFDANGIMYTGMHENSDAKSYFNENGALALNQWIFDNGVWYFAKADGMFAVNEHLNFDNDYDDKSVIYTFDETGKLRANGWFTEGSGENLQWYYARANGCLATNVWMCDSQGWLYLNYSGGMRKNASARGADGTRYQLDREGRLASGWYNQGNESSPRWYYADPETGARWTNCWVADSHGWLYLDEYGSVLRHAVAKDSHGKLYLGGDGYPVTNELVEYYDEDGMPPHIVACKAPYPGSRAIGYADENGYLVSNKWVYVVDKEKDYDNWLFFKEDCSMALGEVVYDSFGKLLVDYSGKIVKDMVVRGNYIGEDIDKIYYVNGNGYFADQGWWYTYDQDDDSYDWIYVTADGTLMKKGWIEDSIGWCYIDYAYLQSNVWVVGADNSTLYYIDSTGHMVVNTTIEINNKECTFDEYGRYVA